MAITRRIVPDLRRMLWAVMLSWGCAAAPAAEKIDVRALLIEMVDFENLSRKPEPPFRKAMASSYSRESHKGGDSWFDNSDVGQYVRTETNAGRKEHVLADLRGPGAVARFWSANPGSANVTRFYFDGESLPRIEVPLRGLFGGNHAPFGPEFSYVSGTGGNLYYPIPYAASLKITIEEKERPLHLYYEIDHRTYPDGTAVETFDPRSTGSWEDVQGRVARALTSPQLAPAPENARSIHEVLAIPPGETHGLPLVPGEAAVFSWSARVKGTEESPKRDDPRRAQDALRFLLLEVSFDGEKSIEVPLGDFFGSAPGLNPYENLFFTVKKDGWMRSRLPMPFAKSMDLRVTNAGSIPYEVELELRVGDRAFADRGYHLRAQWGTVTRDTWPFFDMNFLDAKGEGKVVGTVYGIANPVLIWWGEGDQKISVDGEPFPSTFGTGTEDDYGFAYGHNGPFARPFHAQTRVDGPASGGHISLNRWYVLDAIPYATAVRFDQEMWHWMPCRPTWTHVVYWYAKPGSTGPRAVDRKALAPVDLGIRANMLEPLDGEALPFELTGGTAGKERLANCLGAHHLVWRDGKPGDRLAVRFAAPRAARYRIELNLCRSPDYGRHKLSVNSKAVDGTIDCYSPALDWLHAKLGAFDLKEGENTLEVEALEPNPKASGKNLFGLDSIFLVLE
jgi:hypothetical protein